MPALTYLDVLDTAFDPLTCVMRSAYDGSTRWSGYCPGLATMSDGDPKQPQGPQNPSLGDDIEVEDRQKTQVPKRYKVIFHNDDYSTMEFVVEVLRRYFHKSETEAVHIMLTVHRKGSAV